MRTVLCVVLFDQLVCNTHIIGGSGGCAKHTQVQGAPAVHAVRRCTPLLMALRCWLWLAAEVVASHVLLPLHLWALQG